jgi:hypothetical protein
VFGNATVGDEPLGDESDLELGGRWLVSDLRRNRDGADEADVSAVG